MHEAVRARRVAAGYEDGDNFKFNTNERPATVTPEQHRDAKNGVLEDLKTIGVDMIVSMILHDVARDQTYDTRMEYGLNTLAQSYCTFLGSQNTKGIMLMDRDNDRFDHLEHLFQHGLKFAASGYQQDLSSRIMLFGMTNDNASNLSSAADIALGAFRYCVNTAVGAGREPVARTMFPHLAELMWGHEVDGVKRIGGYGFNIMPKEVRSYSYRQRYEAVAGALESFSLGPIEDNTSGNS